MISLSSYLKIGNEYTFTFESGEWFFLEGTSGIRQALAERMANVGQIVKVDRGWFSDRYIVTVIPTDEVTLETWLSAFDSSWRDMGFDSINFMSIEGGTSSSEPGGIVGVIPEVTQIVGHTVGGTLSETIKPLLPYLIIGLVVYAGIGILPELIGSRHARSR